MSKRFMDGLSRLQNQSRIPATTWRQWCNLLRLDPIDAVDVWEAICHPIMVATGKVPEVSYILQMCAARLEVGIFDFKDEVPKVLHIITFFYLLKDERLTKGKTKSALLKFYRKSALQSSPDQPHGIFLQKFIVDLCVVMLVAKVLPAANISLAVVLKPLLEMGDGESEGRVEKVEALLDERLKAIALFKPLQATIPSVEEAQIIAERAEAKRNPGRVHKPVKGIKSGGGFGGG